MSVLREYAESVTQPTLPFGVPENGRYDEVIDPDGALRGGWKGMAEQALAMTADQLHRVNGEIIRFLADDGVTYNRAGQGSLPWQLDPMPLVLDAASWARLDVGLAQRGELLNALLVDLYGPQQMLSSGTIPSAAIFGHSGFARPMARRSAFDPHPLLLSATDLGRDAAGEWHVLGDRVQAPSGLGFALENRRVISQVLPDLYHENELHRMEPYFAALRTALVASTGSTNPSPHIVVLTPGALSETAFDQGFLANALGFPLAQGNELVVSDGFVWMKPAGWPSTTPTERIDVIVRRVDAEWCDPLEMRANSRLGIAGLSEAVRRGNVRLINGLGAGILENPALIPFMPEICERLLGEKLRIPSVPTWWCGNDDDRAAVLARVAAGDPGLIVRAIDEPRKALAGLTPKKLKARILAAPHRFVGQDVMALSQAPVWHPTGQAHALPLTLRAFTLRYGSTYRPLVGGLATVQDSPDAAPRTKDVWVLKSSGSDPDQGLADITPLPVARMIPSTSPRILQDMFWAGRYAERAEDLLRLVLTAGHEIDQHSGHPTASDGQATRVLMGALQRLAGARWVEPDAEFRSLLLDSGRVGSAAHSILRLRTSLEGVRDQLSGDTWRVFSHTDRAVKALRISAHPHRTAESTGRMLSAILSLHGVTSNMMRDAGWHMIEAGRYLERALQVCHLLIAGASDRRDPHVDRAVLESLLTASESVVTYRRRYRGAMRTSDVLDLLLFGADNPRSLSFALSELHGHLAGLPASTGSTRPERLLEHIETEVSETGVARLVRGNSPKRTHLTAFLTATISQLEQVSLAMADLHFEAGPPPVELSSLALIEEMARA